MYNDFSIIVGASLYIIVAIAVTMAFKSRKCDWTVSLISGIIWPIFIAYAIFIRKKQG